MVTGETMRIPTELQHILSSDPAYLGGAVRFAGTRVPVQALIDTLDEGGTVDDFMDGWPGVDRQAAEAILHWEQDQARRVFGLELAA